jgi:hypothetical protein
MEKTREFQELMTIEGKLAELLAAHNLVYTFSSDDYPISLTVEANLYPSAQMEMFANDDAGVLSRYAKLCFIFQDGEIVVRTYSRLIISDALLSKIKGMAKKMHYLYLQAYHRYLNETKEYNQT